MMEYYGRIALTTEDGLNLGWEIGSTFRIQRAASNCAAVYDTVLGYHNNHVVVLRKQGFEQNIVQHLTPFDYGVRHKVLVPMNKEV